MCRAIGLMRHKTSMVITRTNVREMSCYSQFTCVVFAFPEAARQQPVGTMATLPCQNTTAAAGVGGCEDGVFYASDRHRRKSCLLLTGGAGICRGMADMEEVRGVEGCSPCKIPAQSRAPRGAVPGTQRSAGPAGGRFSGSGVLWDVSC